MNDKCGNIYQFARKDARLTQEQAAELLNVSVRSLADYESGKTVPKDDIVCQMVTVYRASWLGYQHLRLSNEVGRRFLPELNLADLSRSVLRLQKEVGDLRHINEDMIEIACDGIVDASERDKWGFVTKEIHEMAGAALAVIYSMEAVRG